MIPDENELQGTEECHVSISLGDDSNVYASSKGTKAVTWSGPEGLTQVHLSETLAARDLAMRLLSVPALTRKEMAVLFLPKKALILDLRSNLRVIGIAQKDADGLYYINTDGSDDPKTIDSSTDCAMIAVARQLIEEFDIVIRKNESTTSLSDTSSDSYDSSDTNSDISELNYNGYETTSSEEELSTSDEDDIEIANDSFDDDGTLDCEGGEDICFRTKVSKDDGALWHKKLE